MAINHEILPQVYFNNEDEESMKMSIAFQTLVITTVNIINLVLVEFIKM